VRDGELLEYAEFAGNRYGTRRAPVEHALTRGTQPVLEIELQGARQVRMAMPDARLVMLVPPTWSDLVGRLTSRGTEQSDAVYARRSEEHTSELQSRFDLVCRLLLEKKKNRQGVEAM